MVSRTIKFTIGSRKYEINKKHVMYAAIATTSYLAIMYKNRCSNLSDELSSVAESRERWKDYGKFMTENALDSGIARRIDIVGKPGILFEYEA